MKGHSNTASLILITIFLTSSLYGQSIGYDEFFSIVELYKSGRYDIIQTKLNKLGYSLEKHVPDYSQDGINYIGDFSFVLKKKHTIIRNTSYYEHVNHWTFATKEYPSAIEFEISFEFEDQLAHVLFKSLRDTWTNEFGAPTDNTCGNPGKECFFFLDNTEVYGKDIEDQTSLVKLTPRHRFRVGWNTFLSDTKVLEGTLEYRLVKFPIETTPEEYFDQQQQASQLHTIPLKRLGNLYTIELRIGDKNFHYIIDSGASDINISPATEVYLRGLGVIRDSDYLKPQTYVLADGSRKVYRRVLLARVSLGGFNIDNVVASIGEDENQPLLLGKSFLDKFTHWKINNKESTVEFKIK